MDCLSSAGALVRAHATTGSAVNGLPLWLFRKGFWLSLKALLAPIVPTAPGGAVCRARARAARQGSAQGYRGCAFASLRGARVRVSLLCFSVV